MQASEAFVQQRFCKSPNQNAQCQRYLCLRLSAKPLVPIACDRKVKAFLVEISLHFYIIGLTFLQTVFL